MILQGDMKGIDAVQRVGHAARFILAGQARQRRADLGCAKAIRASKAVCSAVFDQLVQRADGARRVPRRRAAGWRSRLIPNHRPSR